MRVAECLPSLPSFFDGIFSLHVYVFNRRENKEVCVICFEIRILRKNILLKHQIPFFSNEKFLNLFQEKMYKYLFIRKNG